MNFNGQGSQLDQPVVIKVQSPEKKEVPERRREEVAQMNRRLRLIGSAAPLRVAPLLLAALAFCSLAAIARSDDKPT